MGTTLPGLDDRIRDYPEEDVWETDETDSYPDDDHNWTGWPADSSA